MQTNGRQMKIEESGRNGPVLCTGARCTGAWFSATIAEALQLMETADP
ncbi:MAG: hypothetical protein K0B15_00665 [Lentimicrobium sp.]|nr:hypothetical protein [Lentimicrobium sp.]